MQMDRKDSSPKRPKERLAEMKSSGEVENKTGEWETRKKFQVQSNFTAPRDEIAVSPLAFRGIPQEREFKAEILSLMFAIMLHIASHYEAEPLLLCNRPQPPAKLHFPCSRFGHEISWTWHSLAFAFASFCASAVWVVKRNRNLRLAILAAFLCSGR